MQLDNDQKKNFCATIWDFYQRYGRQFAWRTVHDPYYIVVSEIMLQQTQTYRVEPKFALFIEEFPSFESLARANLQDVLSVWQGLGYNRRAKALLAGAKLVMEEYNGQLPADVQTLQTFPGIGYATASSICAFAFNMPTIFIETNIRTIFLHHFFRDQEGVHDKQLLPLIEQTVDHDNPREWYYALMDYGVHLKKQFKNPSRKSVHHTRQSTFVGSDRQIRGAILRVLTNHGIEDREALVSQVCDDAQRAEKILQDLIDEQFIVVENNKVCIAQE